MSAVPVVQRHCGDDETGVPRIEEPADLAQLTPSVAGAVRRELDEVGDFVIVGAEERKVTGNVVGRQEIQMRATGDLADDGATLVDAHNTGPRISAPRRNPGIVASTLGLPVHDATGEHQIGQQRAIGIHGQRA